MEAADAIRSFDTDGSILFCVDPRRGDLSEWRASRRGRMQSLTQEMGLDCGRKVSSDSLVSEEPRNYMELYDARQEKLGWYRIARAAEICHIDPLAGVRRGGDGPIESRIRARRVPLIRVRLKRFAHGRRCDE